MSKETDKLLDHNYDGIKEYDNPLPRWWLWLFIITVIWGVIYLWYYHVAGIGEDSDKEYANEMLSAEKSTSKTSSIAKLESTDFVVLTDEASMTSGQLVYEKNCVACHGKIGEGGVGPNLTDDYWIHGGSFENIASIVFNGVPEKGMLSWKTLLRKDEILKVASYVMKIHGTNPPNGKPPQGDLYKPE